MGERLCPWRPRPSQVVLEHLMHMPVMYLVHRTGPTSFIIREDGTEIKRKVSIGIRQCCSCTPTPLGQVVQELCPHLLFVICKVLRVPPSNPLVWQQSLTDRELDEVLRCSTLPEAPLLPATDTKKTTKTKPGDEGTVKRRPIDEEDPCPICYEDMAGKDPEHMVWCKHGCGRNVHGKCMNVWAEHQTRALGKDLTCPLCRSAWGEFKWRPPPPKRRRPDETHEQLSTATHLGVSCSACRKGPVVGKRYRCLICADLDLCEGCFQGGHHPQHPFACKATPTSFAVPAQRPDMMPAATRLAVPAPMATTTSTTTVNALAAPAMANDATQTAVAAVAANAGNDSGGSLVVGAEAQRAGRASARRPGPPRALPPVRRDSFESMASALTITGAPASNTHAMPAPAPPGRGAAAAAPLPNTRLRGLSPAAAAAAAAMARAGATNANTATVGGACAAPDLTLAGAQANVYGVTHTGALVAGAYPLSFTDTSAPAPPIPLGGRQRLALDARVRRGLASLAPPVPPLTLAATALALPLHQRNSSSGDCQAPDVAALEPHDNVRGRSRSATDRRVPGLPLHSIADTGHVAGPLPPLTCRTMLAPLTTNGTNSPVPLEIGHAAGNRHPHPHQQAGECTAKPLLPPTLNAAIQRHQRFARAMSIPQGRPPVAALPAATDIHLTAGVQGHTFITGAGCDPQQPHAAVDNNAAPVPQRPQHLVLGLALVGGMSHGPRDAALAREQSMDMVAVGGSLAPKPWLDSLIVPPVALAEQHTQPQHVQAQQQLLQRRSFDRGALADVLFPGDWQTVTLVSPVGDLGFRASWLAGSANRLEEMGLPGWARPGVGLGSSVSVGDTSMDMEELRGVVMTPPPVLRLPTPGSPLPGVQSPVGRGVALMLAQQWAEEGLEDKQQEGEEVPRQGACVVDGQHEMRQHVGVLPALQMGLGGEVPGTHHDYIDLLDEAPLQASGAPSPCVSYSGAAHGNALLLVQDQECNGLIQSGLLVDEQLCAGDERSGDQSVRLSRFASSPQPVSIMMNLGQAVVPSAPQPDGQAPVVGASQPEVCVDEGMVPTLECDDGHTQEAFNCVHHDHTMTHSIHELSSSTLASEQRQDCDVNAMAIPAAECACIPSTMWDNVHENPVFGILSLSLTSHA